MFRLSGYCSFVCPLICFWLIAIFDSTFILALAYLCVTRSIRLALNVYALKKTLAIHSFQANC